MRRIVVLLAFLLFAVSAIAQQKPVLTLDDFFNYVQFGAVEMSPDGSAVAFTTRRADWAQERFRSDTWLVRNGQQPILLTHSGEDSSPKWSPDGRWVAFVSLREMAWTKPAESGEKEKVAHLYAISVSGGEAFPVTRGEESVHTFAWSSDSQSLYFATRVPWSKVKRESYKKEWKDVERYREQERGDVIARIGLADALARAQAVTPYSASEDAKKDDDKKKQEEDVNKGKETAETPGTMILARCDLEVSDLAVSHDGRTLAFISRPSHHRLEGVKEVEIFLLPASGGAARQLTHNQALESDLRWGPDDRHILFSTGTGGVEDVYQREQERVYSMDVGSGKAQRWGSQFTGALNAYEVAPDGSLVATGQVGAENQVYSERSAADPLKKISSWDGAYRELSLAEHSPRLAFVHSAFDKPEELYVADSANDLAQAKPVTAFNRLFTERDLPRGRTYKWKSEDGAEVEGILLYPPGKFGAKNLPMLTLIHGGPEAADLNSFGANWYDWAAMAASRGYLVFRPNYRGSIGYGDKFELQVSPNIVSTPGNDILTGVDALVKDGIANIDKLTVGGYSYGGYMTNWLITQTTRFKAAVSGAGAVEHIVNWGNDDLTFDDAWYLGGTPWEVPKTYNQEAAIFQISKVKTPTHIVGGAIDIRVYIGEQYLLERALHILGVPSTLLIFPGEGHGLTKNPWHGKIKVREELKWLEKYCPAGSQ